MTHSFVIVRKEPDSSFSPFAVIDSNDCSIAVLGSSLPNAKWLIFEWSWLPSFFDDSRARLNPWKKIANEDAP